MANKQYGNCRCLLFDLAGFQQKKCRFKPHNSLPEIRKFANFFTSTDEIAKYQILIILWSRNRVHCFRNRNYTWERQHSKIKRTVSSCVFYYLKLARRKQVKHGPLCVANLIILRCGPGSNFDSFLLSWKLFKSS